MKLAPAIAVTLTLTLSGVCLAQHFQTNPEYIAFLKSHGKTEEDTTSIWWITEQFPNAKRTWKELLGFHEQHVRLYPASEHRETVERRIKILRRMLDDDKPPVTQKTERLIYELREVKAVQFMQPNDGLKILRTPWPTTLTEEEESLPPDAKAKLMAMKNRVRDRRHAAQILYEEIGFDCIPTLIDHIDDDTLTRSVDYWRDFVYSHSVLTVGDCCQQILDELVPPARIFDVKTDPEETKLAMKRYYAQRVAQIEKNGRTKP